MQYQESDFYKLIAEKVKMARQAANLSQAELADKIGMKRTSITNIENGQQKIQIYTLYLISEVLHLPVFALLPTSDSLELDKNILIANKLVMTDEGLKQILTKNDIENVLKVIR
jgi:transcriptional regulator with XRE-family HTH domain